MRWTDEYGHQWPITGHWCDTCGLPLIPVGGSPRHPLCEESDQHAQVH